MKSPPRMTKQSRARQLAKNHLADRLHAHYATRTAAANNAKRPHEPRIVQRQKRLAAKAAEKQRLAELKKVIDERLFPKLAVAERKEVQAA